MTARARCFLLTALLLISIQISSASPAAEPMIIPGSAEAVAEGVDPGWHPKLKFAGNMALGQSKNNPGMSDGVSLQMGYLVDGMLDFLGPNRHHEWANRLKLELSYSRTPLVDAFIKSADKVDFKSTYLFHPTRIRWLGPFVSFRLNAPMLPGDLVLADPANVIRLDAGETLAFNDGGEPIDEDGAVIDAAHPSVDQAASGDRVSLTGAFAPLTLRESLGLFAVPLQKSWLKTDIRLGFGAWETFVRGGYVVDDNEDTPDLLELRRMENSVQIGPELGVTLSGNYKENVNYTVSALFMQPIYQNTETELDGGDLMNLEFEAILGFKITKYFSVDYAFKAYKQPLITEDWQIQNSLLLSVVFEIPSPTPPPEPEPVCPPVPACPEPDTTAAPPGVSADAGGVPPEPPPVIRDDGAVEAPEPGGPDTADTETEPTDAATGGEPSQAAE